MGTNYYLMNKKNFELDQQIDNLLRAKDVESIQQKIENLITEEYKDIINVLDENKLENIKESFEDKIREMLEGIASNLKYGLDYPLSIQEREAKHIGKSSWGWLFNFQDQDEWHSYDQFKSYITNKDNMKDKVIINEYNEKLTPKEMLKIIDDKQKDKRNHENPDNFHYCRNVDGYRFSSGDFS